MSTLKPKLGILTFNRACNYGAVLQAYALKCVCDELGYESHIVNYWKDADDLRPNLLRTFLSSGNKKRAAITLCRQMLSYTGDQRRWNAFQEFRHNYLNESPACRTADEVAALNYQKYVVGSDQIWNYRITGNEFDPVYFGQIPGDSDVVLYAASAHDTPFPLDMERKFKAILEQSVPAVGVREQKLAEYASSVSGVHYPAVVDPTLLAGREVFDLLADRKVPKEPYILIYQIDSNPNSDISVRTLESRFGCPAYTMTVPRLGDKHGRKGEAGPEEFLTLLKNAKFLVTNSFHGIALSLLLEKQFFVYENGGVMTRIDSLLDTVSLTDRKVKMVADIDPSRIIDFKPVREKLAHLRNESMVFLRSALDGTYVPRAAEPIQEMTLPKMDERKKEDCSGCAACVEVCPVDAIAMVPDEEGFCYPQIDREKCVGCRKCDQFCSFVSHHLEELPRAYGVKHRVEATRVTSRSGGAFVALSDLILHEEGFVYGAALTDDFTVRHIRAATPEQRDRMKGAKYVQSDVCDIYAQVADDLTDGKGVLFSGTPCQVAGLRSVLSEKHIADDKLICCDLVCHGAPSPLIWKEYVGYVEKTYGKIASANFRDKSFGWDPHVESFVLESGKKLVRREYSDLFYEHVMLRPSCHDCRFANIQRVGDITLADFWGIEKNEPDFNDNKGVSLVLVNTRKGTSLLDRAKTELEWFECPVENCMQPPLIKPTAKGGNREAFWRDHGSMEFADLLKKYTTPISPLAKTKRAIKRILFKLGLRKFP